MIKMFQKIWDVVNGNKLLIGLVLDRANTSFIPETSVWYGILELISYIFIFVGGGHKILKTGRKYYNDKTEDKGSSS